MYCLFSPFSVFSGKKNEYETATADCPIYIIGVFFHCQDCHCQPDIKK